MSLLQLQTHISLCDMMMLLISFLSLSSTRKILSVHIIIFYPHKNNYLQKLLAYSFKNLTNWVKMSSWIIPPWFSLECFYKWTLIWCKMSSEAFKACETVKVHVKCNSDQYAWTVTKVSIALTVFPLAEYYLFANKLGFIQCYYYKGLFLCW